MYWYHLLRVLFHNSFAQIDDLCSSGARASGWQCALINMQSENKVINKLGLAFPSTTDFPTYMNIFSPLVFVALPRQIVLCVCAKVKLCIPENTALVEKSDTSIKNRANWNCKGIDLQIFSPTHWLKVQNSGHLSQLYWSMLSKLINKSADITGDGIKLLLRLVLETSSSMNKEKSYTFQSLLKNKFKKCVHISSITCVFVVFQYFFYLMHNGCFFFLPFCIIYTFNPVIAEQFHLPSRPHRKIKYIPAEAVHIW